MLGENAKAEQNFQRALSLAPEDSDIRHNWGWYLCSNDRPRESIPEFEHRTAQSVLQDAGSRPHQCRHAAARRSATSPAPRAFYRRRWRARPPTRPRCTGSRSSPSARPASTKRARLHEAARAAPAPAPEALYLGMCVERKARRPRRRDALRHPVAQPLSGFGGSQSRRDGALRVTAPPSRCHAREAALPAGRDGRRAACVAARGIGPVDRRGGAAAEARAAPGPRTGGRRLQPSAGAHVRPRLHPQATRGSSVSIPTRCWARWRREPRNAVARGAVRCSRRHRRWASCRRRSTRRAAWTRWAIPRHARGRRRGRRRVRMAASAQATRIRQPRRHAGACTRPSVATEPATASFERQAQPPAAQSGRLGRPGREHELSPRRRRLRNASPAPGTPWLPSAPPQPPYPAPRNPRPPSRRPRTGAGAVATAAEETVGIAFRGYSWSRDPRSQRTRRPERHESRRHDARPCPARRRSTS